MKPSDVKAWRANNAYTQSELARLLGVDVMTVSRWERGVREIPPYLHLALRWLEEKGGEPMKGKKKKTITERRRE